MDATSARPSKKPRNPEIYQKIEKIKSKVDEHILKIQKQSSYHPSRDDIEGYAVQINDVVMRNRDKVREFESYLKAAIIDLTEVPEMHVEMQRISFLAALKDASQKLQLFLDCC